MERIVMQEEITKLQKKLSTLQHMKKDGVANQVDEVEVIRTTKRIKELKNRLEDYGYGT